MEAEWTAREANVSDLLQFSTRHPARRDESDVRQVILNIRASLAPEFEARRIDVDVDIPFGDRVPLDPVSFQQAIEQLVHRALEAMPQGGELSFSSCQITGCYELEIADTGPGLSREARQQLNELASAGERASQREFFSSVVHLMSEYGCQIRAANCAQGGAAVTLRIPRQGIRAAA
jgi:signal transduction histidine kinase